MAVGLVMALTAVAMFATSATAAPRTVPATAPATSAVALDATAPPSPSAPIEAPAAPIAPPPTGPLDLAYGLESHPNWALRAIACMRLEGSSHPGATELLRTLSRDADACVRIFAVAARSLRGDPPAADVVLADPDRRVLRAALRTGLRIDPAELSPIVTPLLRPERREGCLLGVELAACVEDPKLRYRAIDSLGRVIMRLDRAGAGATSPRLEALLHATGGHRPGDWQHLWQESGPRTRSIECAPVSGGHAIARAASFAFAEFAQSLRDAVEQPIDVAFCIDASASMFADLPRAQALADRTGRALADLIPGCRVAVVAYRDRKSEFVTLTHSFAPAGDLTAGELPEASRGTGRMGRSPRVDPRRLGGGGAGGGAGPGAAAVIPWRSALWNLVADKGGTAPEAVLEGLTATYTELGWQPKRRSIAVLIGDGPPHSGTRGFCADAAREARRRLGVTTFVVSALPEGASEGVQGFVEIADAGGGLHLQLRSADDLPSLVIGPDFGDAHRELMAAFRERCDELIR